MALWAPHYCTSPAKETCHFSTETSKDNVSKQGLTEKAKRAVRSEGGQALPAQGEEIGGWHLSPTACPPSLAVLEVEGDTELLFH